MFPRERVYYVGPLDKNGLARIVDILAFLVFHWIRESLRQEGKTYIRGDPKDGALSHSKVVSVIIL